MSNPIIPSDINSWSKAQTAEYYIDEFGWTLTPLIEGSKEPKYPKEQQYGVGRNDLLLDLNNGCNIGLFPSGTHVVLDLDAKATREKAYRSSWRRPDRVYSRCRESGPPAVYTSISRSKTLRRSRVSTQKRTSSSTKGYSLTFQVSCFLEAPA